MEHKSIINTALIIELIVMLILAVATKGLLTLVTIIGATATALVLLEINGQNVTRYNKYSKD